MIGKSLGPYKIIDTLGAGGMGEVFLAEDTRLGRKVAIKVLPAEFASDPERLARFEQEARAAAALNHPHIAAVFDVGSALAEVGGGDEGGSDSGDSGPVEAKVVTHYMVQEYLEGETLGDALRTGRLPLKKALDLNTEVAEALAAAHGAGIIHRDLKPANIFITKDNHAKVLDFGLAKLTEMATLGTADGASKSPTLLGTVAGQVMGTAGYMAPEQVEGTAEIDKRADVFAFGCVLYESVTGSQAFSGTSVLDTLHRIAHSQPRDLGEIDDGLPTEAQRIIGKCLAKEASARYQHVDDLIVDLRVLATQVETGAAITIAATGATSGAGGIDGSPGATGAAGTPAASGVAGGHGFAGAGVSWKVAVPAVIVIGALATFAGTMLRATAPEPLVRRFQIPYPADTALRAGATLGVAFSPDGKWIVFNADRQLWLRAVGELFAEPIRGTEGARNPFFSPDGEQLGFWGDEGQMKRVSITGGAPVPVGPAPVRAHGADWGTDGYIYFGQGTAGIFRLSENGGAQAQLVVEPESGEVLTGPQLLPGNEWLLYSSVEGTSFSAGTILAVSLLDGERKVLLEGGTGARYTPTGHLVYGLDGNLLAIAFDPEQVAVSGGPVSIVEGVTTAGVSGLPQFGFSQRGGIVYLPGSGAGGGRFSLVMVDREGDVEPLPFPAQDFLTLDLAPDDNRIALTIRGSEGSDVWIYEIDGGRSIPLTSDGASRDPVWTPDGQWIYYQSGADGPPSVWRRRADRSAAAERVTEAEAQHRPWAISPDGGKLALADLVGNLQNIALAPADGSGTPTTIVGSAFNEQGPDFSPDGRFIAYMSEETGLYRINVQELDSNRQWAVSPGVGVVPIWSPDGSEIFYYNFADQSIDVAEVTTDPEFRVVATGPLFPAAVRQFTNFDVTSDGQRFLYVSPSTVVTASAQTDSGGPVLHVILDWFEELKERVPTGR